MLKTLTAIALVLGMASAAYADDKSNESFVLQVNPSPRADGNFALISQEDGHNKQATLQFGSDNIAITGQDSDRPDHGRNSALTVQAGNDNFALTAQRNSHDLQNRSAIMQFGNKNAAIVSQR